MALMAVFEGPDWWGWHLIVLLMLLSPSILLLFLGLLSYLIGRWLESRKGRAK